MGFSGMGRDAARNLRWQRERNKCPKQENAQKAVNISGDGASEKVAKTFVDKSRRE